MTIAELRAALHAARDVDRALLDPTSAARASVPAGGPPASAHPATPRAEVVPDAGSDIDPDTAQNTNQDTASKTPPERNA